MRLDYITIFPEYFAPLRQSLTGKAADKGLIEVHVHDLRDFTHDRHRTVDDSPFGGGPGMVLKPEPWGAALDALLADPPEKFRRVDGRDDADPPEQFGRVTVVVPTPSGRPFSQALARELAERDRLVFACGRYEGIDQRVLDLLADPSESFGRVDLVEVSLGDYVLNGGEVAALAVTEAVVRLLPGFMGNAESLVEESHQDGLLEYPVYTRPATWRGREVPEVLLSGDHAAIARWRLDQARRRTARRRPDLLHPSAVGATGEWTIVPATRGDVGELFTLQRACWVQEALANDSIADIPALHESLDDVLAWLGTWSTWVVRSQGRLVGAVRGRLEGQVWDIGRIMVAPDLQGRGLGRALLEHIEAVAPPEATSYVLFTGARSVDNLRMYRKAGFRVRTDLEAPPLAVVLTKARKA